MHNFFAKYSPITLNGTIPKFQIARKKKIFESMSGTLFVLLLW